MVIKNTENITPAKIPANQKIVDELTKLIDTIKFDMDHAPSKKEQIGHSFRLKNIKKVIDIIKKYPKEIKSGEQIKDVKGVGKGTVSRIDEILQTGKLSEIKTDKARHKYVQYTDELQQIIGIGPRTAYDRVTKHNIKSIKDLKKAYNDGIIELTDEIIMGLKYHGIYKQNIPRAEIDMINIYLNEIISQVDKNIKLTICGSYRREKPTSNDIDILITHPKIKTKLQIKSNPKNYLRLFVTFLKDEGFLLDDLTDKDYEVKYMGFCQFRTGNKEYPVRRIDIRYIPFDSYYTSLLYFTGSGEFNNKMRSLAKELGYLLNEYGLYNVKDGKMKKIKVESEKEIFEQLGMEYITPDKRI